MIKEDIHKLLFIDIETVGIDEDLDSLHHTNPKLCKVWDETGWDYFKRKYSEDSELSSNEMFIKRSALLPEFGKIVCISVGFILPNGETKLDSFYGEETDILERTYDLLNKVDKLGFLVCGHNVKNFDLPYIAKRMLINGISIPKILPNYSIKPWESRVLDTKEVWGFNSFGGLSSLNLVCTALGLETSKEGEVNGSNMHKYYYDNSNKNGLDKIKNYCEEDVKCTINLVKKLKNL